MSVTLATCESEIKRIVDQDQPGQMVLKTLSLNYPEQNGLKVCLTCLLLKHKTPSSNHSPTEKKKISRGKKISSKLQSLDCWLLMSSNKSQKTVNCFIFSKENSCQPRICICSKTIFLFIYFFLQGVLGFELRVSCLVDGHSTLKLCLQSIVKPSFKNQTPA
jgi:hypothetical protein